MLPANPVQLLVLPLSLVRVLAQALVPVLVLEPEEVKLVFLPPLALFCILSLVQPETTKVRLETRRLSKNCISK